MQKNCVLCGGGREFLNASSFPQFGKAITSKIIVKAGRRNEAECECR